MVSFLCGFKVVATVERRPEGDLWEENGAVWLLGGAKQKGRTFLMVITIQTQLSSVSGLLEEGCLLSLQSLDVCRHDHKNKPGDSFLLKLKLRGGGGGGEEGQVPSCGLRLSWVMKERPPLLPLEKLTGFSHMKTAQPCLSFSQRQLPCRGEKQFSWVTCKEAIP